MLSIVGCAPQNEEAFHISTSAISTTPAPSRWESTNTFPVQLSISADFESNEIAAIESMALQWGTSSDSGIQFFDTTATVNEKSINSINDYQDGEMAIYKLQNWPSSFPATALAVTQIFGLRRNIGLSSEYIQIQHADIMVNYSNFSFSTNYSFGYDLQTVVLHEMGHFLGLYHEETSADQSIMYPSISRFRDNRVPKDDDTVHLNEKYGLAGGAVAANTGHRSAFNQNIKIENDLTEPVVVLFELHANGVERIKIKRTRDIATF